MFGWMEGKTMPETLVSLYLPHSCIHTTHCVRQVHLRYVRSIKVKSPDTFDVIAWTNALQYRFYMFSGWTKLVLNYILITP